MEWSDNPEKVRAYLVGDEPNPEMIAYYDEPVSVCISRCTCGWFDYFKTLAESPENCPQCEKHLENKMDEKKVDEFVNSANPQPTIGRAVLYRLSSIDVEQINRRRTTGKSIADRIKMGGWPIGAQAHIGNEVHTGEVYPMIVTYVCGAGLDELNGQVFLDGNDVLWVTGIGKGVVPGTWNWPVKS
jgi:hypothetical protein